MVRDILRSGESAKGGLRKIGGIAMLGLAIACIAAPVGYAILDITKGSDILTPLVHDRTSATALGALSMLPEVVIFPAGIIGGIVAADKGFDLLS